MARLLLKKAENKYRLFCNTLDRWVSPTLSGDLMIEYLNNEWVEKHTKTEAIERVMMLEIEEESPEFYSYSECEKCHKRHLYYLNKNRGYLGGSV